MRVGDGEPIGRRRVARAEEEKRSCKSWTDAFRKSGRGAVAGHPLRRLRATEWAVPTGFASATEAKWRGQIDSPEQDRLGESRGA